MVDVLSEEIMSFLIFFLLSLFVFLFVFCYLLLCFNNYKETNLKITQSVIWHYFRLLIFFIIKMFINIYLLFFLTAVPNMNHRPGGLQMVTKFIMYFSSLQLELMIDMLLTASNCTVS